MNVLALPVANGVLPRPGGSISGLFLDDFSLRTLSSLGAEATAFLVPLTQDGQALYPAGMLVRIDDLNRAQAVNPVTWNSEEVLVASLSGIAHAWARRFVVERGFVVAESVQELDLKELRP